MIQITEKQLFTYYSVSKNKTLKDSPISSHLLCYALGYFDTKKNKKPANP